jgi:DNA-binding CsgD family transcriptional regulator
MFHFRSNARSWLRMRLRLNGRSRFEPSDIFSDNRHLPTQLQKCRHRHPSHRPVPTHPTDLTYPGHRNPRYPITPAQSSGEGVQFRTAIILCFVGKWEGKASSEECRATRRNWRRPHMCDDLTRREEEVMRLVAVHCLTSKEAAQVLGISFRTVEIHRARVLEKMKVRNVAELARQLATSPLGV